MLPPDSPTPAAPAVPTLSIHLGDSLETVAAASTRQYDFADRLEDTWLQAIVGPTAFHLLGLPAEVVFPPGKLITVHTVAAHVEQVDAVVHLEPLDFDGVFALAAKLSGQIGAARWPRSEEQLFSLPEIKQQFRDPRSSETLKRYVASWVNAEGDLLRLQVSRLKKGEKSSWLTKGSTDEFLLVAEVSNLQKYRDLFGKMTRMRERHGTPADDLARPIEMHKYLAEFRGQFPETSGHL